VLDQVLRVVGPRIPVILAGGIATSGDVQTALEAGAAAAVAGTAFLATEESRAQDGYKQHLVESDETILTELFGMGWPHAPHRVLPNEATRRWLTGDPRGPAPVRMLHTVANPFTRVMPPGMQARMTRRSATGPLDLTAAPPTVGMPAATLETHPLYAGATVARISEIRPAAAVLYDLTP
jgi:nitronate monooxygenase